MVSPQIEWHGWTWNEENQFLSCRWSLTRDNCKTLNVHLKHFKRFSLYLSTCDSKLNWSGGHSTGPCKELVVNGIWDQKIIMRKNTKLTSWREGEEEELENHVPVWLGNGVTNCAGTTIIPLLSHDQKLSLPRVRHSCLPRVRSSAYLHSSRTHHITLADPNQGRQTKWTFKGT